MNRTRGHREGTGRDPRGNREVLKVEANGVRGYIDEGEVIKVENCRRKCGKDEGKDEGRIRAYRRYCKEDVEDIEASTKAETAKKMEGEGDGAERDVGNKNCTTEERVDCEIEEY